MKKPKGQKDTQSFRSHFLLRKTEKRMWLGIIACCIVLMSISGCFAGEGRYSDPKTLGLIAQPEYPQMAPYPDLSAGYNMDEYDAWYDDTEAQRRNLGDISSLESFFAGSARTFLTGAEEENRVYSPLNVYMALSMLAQITDGESRGQILTLLGSGSMDALRQQASDVWNSNYRDDGALTSILASSLWLDKDVKFNQDTMDILARDFYASSYQGEMGSGQFNQALQDWLSEQTGGLLDKQAGNIKLSKETVLALASTFCFNAKWQFKFNKADTAPQTFHTPAGDVETDFMHQDGDQRYCWGEKFSAVGQNFAQGNGVLTMWFLLPDEGVTPDELLSDSEAMDFLLTSEKYGWENRKRVIVHESIPKFDVSSQSDLRDGLQALGVTDVFDPALSDFTPMITDETIPVAVSEVSHAARVVIDEEGCTAAAFTVIPAEGAGMPPDDEVDFILDRPFLFCITGINGLPLFAGIVNYPAVR